MTEQFVEEEGRTTEEALERALNKIGAEREHVRITVLDEGKKTLFGLISKPARVRVSLKEDPASTPEGILKVLLDEMGIKSDIHTRATDGNIYLTVNTPSAGLLIGRRGRTLNAIQHIINCIVNRSSLVKRRVIVDAEQYRERREEILTNLAHKLATKVKSTGQEVVVEPMNPQDRRIIHLALQDDKDVTTFSRGEGSFRSVVITLKESAAG
ncbi:KH domain-containing protein [Candidatus Poribacteria bacterium]|nr:KH domain-containing protein [Candidatus Poribacteria bacterium]